jgi:hypothetical protein
MLVVLVVLSALYFLSAKELTIQEILDDTKMSMEQLFPQLNTTSSNLKLDSTGSFVYTYHVSSGKFSGPAFDGSGDFSVTGCSGLQHVNYCGSGQCRNNVGAECCKNCGPIPEGQWLISSMITFKGMPNCYALSPSGTQKCPARNGFLIHGGDGTTCASGNPSDGCIVIESDSVRYKIKGGGTLNVHA